MTLYESASGNALSKNGDDWHELRSGNFPGLSNISRQLNELIKMMMHQNPENQPSSTTIGVLTPLESKSKVQLAIELNMERQKNDILIKKLKETQRLLKLYVLSRTPINKKTRPPKDHRPLIEVSNCRLLRSGMPGI